MINCRQFRETGRGLTAIYGRIRARARAHQRAGRQHLRHRPSVALLLLLLPINLPAVRIEQAYAIHMDTGSFQGVREFFTGREYPGNRLIVRSSTAERAGMYFILMLDTRLRQAGLGSAEIEVIATGSKEPRRYTWPLADSAASRAKVLYCGLTGADWPAADAQPLAWKLTLRDAAGQALATWQSFLY
jgi:hypothetical protein